MLQDITYCPSLYSRAAEIKALFQLPAPAKDRMLPLIIARPWPNANLLERTWEKINEALGGRRFALDLDRTRRHSSSTRPAAAQFAELFDSSGGYSNYYEVVESLASSLPVLRIAEGAAFQLREQEAHISALDRGVVARIEYGTLQDAAGVAEQIVETFEDVVVFVDVGWTTDVLSRELWASGIVQRITAARPEVEIVVSGSSFPDAFTNIGARGITPVSERMLFESLVRRHNAAVLVYGDWGSTRPPTDPVPMRNIPRIDLPTDRQWISFRRDNGSPTEEDYASIARRVMSDASWPAGLSIWGTYTISCTANNLPGAIKGPPLATAARVNIHLHRQAFFDVPEIVSDADEPFTDD